MVAGTLDAIGGGAGGSIVVHAQSVVGVDCVHLSEARCLSTSSVVRLGNGILGGPGEETSVIRVMTSVVNWLLCKGRRAAPDLRVRGELGAKRGPRPQARGAGLYTGFEN